jgi:hypothetical protein
MDPIQRARLTAENALGVVRYAAKALRKAGQEEDADAVLAYLDRIDRDDPLFDCTDAAHPAWWRAHDYVARRFSELVRRVRAERDELKRQLTAAITVIEIGEASALFDLSRPLAEGTPIPDLPATLAEASACVRCGTGRGEWRNVAGQACWICETCTLAVTRCAP